MKWTAFTAGRGTRYWISGIYKIVSYRKGEFMAYFIQDHQKNWGDYVCPPPDQYPPNTPVMVRDRGCWRTLTKAKADCRTHSKIHTPAPRTVKRAAELLQVFKDKHSVS